MSAAHDPSPDALLQPDLAESIFRAAAQADEDAPALQASQNEIDTDRAMARAEYFAHHALRPGKLPTRDLADHAPANDLRAYWP